MRNDWKRILAAALAACMLLGDSSFAYAAESVPTEEASENEADLETVVEPEEEVIQEEPQMEADAEVEEQEPTETEETLPEENEVVEEVEDLKESVEIPADAEAQPLNDEREWITVGQKFETGILDEDDYGYISKSYYFQPEKTGNYGFPGISDIDFYVKTEDEWWEWSGKVKGQCYYKVSDDDSETLTKYCVLEAGKTYRLRIDVEVPSNTSFAYSFVEDTAGDTSIKVADSVKVQMSEGEKKIFSTQAEDPTFAELVCDKSITIQSLGDARGSIGGYFILENSQKEYFLITANEACEITVKGVAFESTKLDEKNLISKGEDKHFFFEAEQSGYYYFKHADMTVYAIVALNKEGEYQQCSTDTFCTSNGEEWMRFNVPKGYENVYVFLYADDFGGSKEVVFTLQKEDPIAVEKKEWSGTVTVPANSSIDISYSGLTYGDYLIQLPETLTGSFGGWGWDITFEPLSVDGNISRNEDTIFLDDTLYYSVCSLYTRYPLYVGKAKAEFILKITNHTEEEQTITLLTNEDLAKETDAGHRVEAGYVKIEPESTRVYQFEDCEWVYCTDDRILINREERFDKSCVLESDKTYYAKLTSNEKIVAMDLEVSEGRELKLNLDQKFYMFTPSVSGTYYYEGISGGKAIWNNETKQFVFFSGSKGIELEADTSYVFFANSLNGTLGLRSEITVLDYDYYQALIASGGSVTVDGSDVTIDQGIGKFTLIRKLLSLLGIVTYEQSDKAAFEDANEYWKNDKDGAFAATEFYKLEGQGSEQKLVACESMEEAEQGDVVVIKYEPEIVWVDSMNVSADKTNLAPDETVQLHVSAKAATEKYPFKETPVFTYTSSDEQILTVDEQGMVTAHKSGTATITVTADQALREEENCVDRLVTKTIKLSVGTRYQIHYENVTGPEGSLAEGTPKAYDPKTTTTLVAATANEGYEFAGWYSDAKLTKKITSIPKNSKGDKTVYAKWTLHNYKINYELNGGRFPDNYPTTFTIEGGVTLAEPTKYGYTFDSWTVEDPILTYDEESREFTIKAGITSDITISVNWKWAAKAALKVIKLDKDNVLRCSYDAKTKRWIVPTINFMIETTPAGMEIDEDNLTYVALCAEDGGNVIWSGSGTLSIPKDTIQDAGKYILKGSYQYGDEQYELESAAFEVAFEKRDYPIDHKLTWVGISNLRENLTFEQIYDEIKQLAQPSEDALLDGESLIEDKDITITQIKNAKNQTVSGKTKLTSGTYTVTFDLGTNEHFHENAAATLEIEYAPLKVVGVEYQTTEEEHDRTAGSTIAFRVADTNKTSYPTKVMIQPIFETPWDGPVPAERLAETLEAYGYTGFTTTVTGEEAKAKTPLLKLEEMESGMISAEPAGTTAGKRNVTVATAITDGTNTLVLSTTIRNFTVVSGDAEATKDITLSLKNQTDAVLDPYETTDEGPVYLFGKQTTAVSLKLAYETVNYEGSSNKAKLSWKSTNTKIASVKTVKNADYVTVTIPKNAAGVVEITATANDAAKNSRSVQLIIVDTGMRLDTTSVTLNSLAENDTAIAYLYPNMLAQDLGEHTGDIQEQFENKKVALYKKVKNGYQLYEDMFETSYDVEDGSLEIGFAQKGTKAQTYTAYIGVTASGEEQPSEYYAIKIKDTYKMPKAPTMKVTGAYDTAYEGSAYAELTLTANAAVSKITLLDERFEVTESKPNSDKTVWTLKVCAKEDAKVFPTGKQTSKTTKGVKFEVSYEEYKNCHTVSTNLTITNTQPKLSVYGRHAYAPVYYTDLAFRYVTVAIPLDERLIDGADSAVIAADQSYVTFVDSEGAEVVKVSLKDSEKFELVKASCDSDVEIYSKKTPVEAENAILLTVRVKDDQKKNVSLQFEAESKNLTKESKLTTGKLTIKAAKFASEPVTWIDYDTDVPVKSLTFNSAFQGKESVKLSAAASDAQQGALYSALDAGDYELIFSIRAQLNIEGADAKSRELLRKDALLTVVDMEEGFVRIGTTDKTFNYNSAKLRLTYEYTVADQTVKLKSNVLSLNFKKALKPKVTLSNAKLLRGLTPTVNGTNVQYTAPSVNVTAKLANMPVGYSIYDIRLTDPADMEKYTLEFQKNGYDSDGNFTLQSKCDVLPPSGKDKIEVTYDICTVTGEIVSVDTFFTLTVADSAALKVDVKSINLYNSVVGQEYGKTVTFSDAKGHAVIVKILNYEELKKAGIRVESMNQENGPSGTSEIKFYVDGSLKRGAEKTYNVKAKIRVVGAIQEGYHWKQSYEKTVTFKLVLKK